MVAGIIARMRSLCQGVRPRSEISHRWRWQKREERRNGEMRIAGSSSNPSVVLLCFRSNR
jgi:hypothetical protein